MVKRLIVIFMICLSGCATARQWAPAVEKVGVCPPEKACIYVMRPANLGSMLHFIVKDNDNLVGETGPRSYLAWQRDPGEVNLTSHAEDVAKFGFTAQAGRTYYFLQSFKFGIISARNSIDSISEDEALKYLALCHKAIAGK